MNHRHFYCGMPEVTKAIDCGTVCDYNGVVASTWLRTGSIRNAEGHWRT